MVLQSLAITAPIENNNRFNSFKQLHHIHFQLHASVQETRRQFAVFTL